jgi:poly-gamma-glutamate capsule biosynthesis protein CapA/YwtB (metallophosphatase superfamily)
MKAKFDIALTGDSIVNRRISVQKKEKFLSAIKIIQDADVAYTNLEVPIHDYDGPEVYPAAEGGWTYMRGPRFVADELKWAGFDIVSNANNHALDYSYGALFSTNEALDRAGLAHAGTGRTLGEAREPAYLDTEKGRVALISMCSTFVGWARAGEVRRDVKGRPGLNPLRFYYRADNDTIETLKKLAVKLGWSTVQNGKTWIFSPAGLENTIYRFVETGEPGITTVASEEDVEGNLCSIRDARRQADVVLVHLHNHEWSNTQGLSVPSDFVSPFAHQCIDAGADVFIGQGSHAQLRGIELYKKKAIFYDPGDFIRMSGTTSRLPADFYWNPRYDPIVRNWDATPSDAFEVRKSLPPMLNPLGGIPGPVKGAVIAVLTLEGDTELTELKLYPVVHTDGRRRCQFGLPLLADSESAKIIIEHISQLSKPFGTCIEYKDGIGVVQLS